jgi:hypothetical protein
MDQQSILTKRNTNNNINTITLFFLSWFIVTFCCSGGVLCLLENPPLFQRLESGGTILLGGDFYQYLGETCLVLLLNALLSCLILGMAVIESRILLLCVIIGFIVTLRIYVTLFCGKQQYYHYHIKNNNLLWMSFLYVPVP